MTTPLPPTNGPANTAPVMGDSSTQTPDVIQRLTFSSETIKRLTANDFDLDSKEMITLKDNDCMLVLFYVENAESRELAKIWALVAQQVAGPRFGAINMLSERKVAEAFTRIKSDGSNPLHWASLRQYPFILVYRNRWPVAVYNGVRNVQDLIDYSLTLACQAGYYEPLQTGGGMQVDPDRNITMSKYSGFDLQGLGVSSVNFQNSIRNFDPNAPMALQPVTGTPTPPPTGTPSAPVTETPPPSEPGTEPGTENLALPAR
jgi:hypothetical protein